MIHAERKLNNFRAEEDIKGYLVQYLSYLNNFRDSFKQKLCIMNLCFTYIILIKHNINMYKFETTCAFPKLIAFI